MRLGGGDRLAQLLPGDRQKLFLQSGPPESPSPPTILKHVPHRSKKSSMHCWWEGGGSRDRLPARFAQHAGFSLSHNPVAARKAPNAMIRAGGSSRGCPPPRFTPPPHPPFQLDLVCLVFTVLSQRIGVIGGQRGSHGFDF